MIENENIDYQTWKHFGVKKQFYFKRKTYTFDMEYLFETPSLRFPD